MKKLVNAYELIGEVDSDELDKELSEQHIKHGEVEVLFMLPNVNMITEIEFLRTVLLGKPRIKVALNNKKTVVVGIDGEYLEEKESKESKESMNIVKSLLRNDKMLKTEIQ